MAAAFSLIRAAVPARSVVPIRSLSWIFEMFTRMSLGDKAVDGPAGVVLKRWVGQVGEDVCLASGIALGLTRSAGLFVHHKHGQRCMCEHVSRDAPEQVPYEPAPTATADHNQARVLFRGGLDDPLPGRRGLHLLRS